MAGDVNFRGITTPQPQTTQDNTPKAPLEEITPDKTLTANDIPYTLYRAEFNKPFSAEYFSLETTWNEYEELSDIESYLTDLVNSGSIDNTTQAVKEKLKQIEKAVGADKTERTIVKLGKIAAYTKFLTKVAGIERNNYKYGSR